jgi:hypothetical protein
MHEGRNKQKNVPALAVLQKGLRLIFFFYSLGATAATSGLTSALYFSKAYSAKIQQVS